MTNILEVENKIITLRNQQVILANHVAELYGVETREVNQAIKNNPEKFPEGYVFELDQSEKDEVIKIFDNLGNIRYSPSKPKAFTEKRTLYAGNHFEESEGGGNHYCHRGGVCETEGAVESDHTGSAAGGELRGAEDVAAARRPVGGESADGRDADSKQRDLIRAEPGDVQVQAFGKAGK